MQEWLLSDVKEETLNLWKAGEKYVDFTKMLLK